jgi:hypothetical protein
MFSVEAAVSAAHSELQAIRLPLQLSYFATGASSAFKFKSWIPTNRRKIFLTRLTSTFCMDRLN